MEETRGQKRTKTDKGACYVKLDSLPPPTDRRKILKNLHNFQNLHNFFYKPENKP